MQIAIDTNVISSEETATLLSLATQKDGVRRVLDTLENKLIHQYSAPIITRFDPCKKALAKIGYRFDAQRTVGTISFADISQSLMHYRINNCVSFYRFTINNLRQSTQLAVVSCLRSFARLADIDTLTNCTDDYEMYYDLDAVSDKKIAQLTCIDIGINETKTFAFIKKTIGKKTFTDIVNTLQDYTGMSKEDDAFTTLVIERIYALACQIEFDRQTMFSDAYLFTASRFSKLPAMLRKAKKQTPCANEKTLLDKLITLSTTVMPFIDKNPIDLERKGDVSLLEQQYLHFVGMNDMVCLERAEQNEMRIMETGDSATHVLSTDDPAQLSAFNNYTIGYHLIDACATFLGETDYV